MKSKKTLIVSIITTFMLLTGTTFGILLVQQNQDIREKAAGSCSHPGQCGTSAGCDVGEKCVVEYGVNVCEADSSCPSQCSSASANGCSNKSTGTTCTTASGDYGKCQKDGQKTSCYCKPDPKPIGNCSICKAINNKSDCNACTGEGCKWIDCSKSPTNSICTSIGSSDTASSVCCPKGNKYCADSVTSTTKCSSGLSFVYSCISGQGYDSGKCEVNNSCVPSGGDGTSCENTKHGKCVSNDVTCDPSTNYGASDCPVNNICVPVTATCSGDGGGGGGGGIGGGGGGGGGGSSGKCGLGSAASCQDKKPGESCNNGTCKANGQKDKNGNENCACNKSDPGGGGGGGGGGGSCASSNANPSSFSVSADGNLTLYLKSIYKLKIYLKKNADSCSATDNDTMIDTTSNEPDANKVTKVTTDYSVISGDKICVYADHADENKPLEGYISPEGSLCGDADKGKQMDISNLSTQISTDGATAITTQCWGDYPGEKGKDCDFNDLAILFAVSGGSGGGGGDVVLGPGLNILVRFQGITSKKNDQEVTASLYQSGGQIWNTSGKNISNGSDGVYALSISKSVDSISAGTYDFKIKGESHLQKSFTNIVYNGGKQVIDLSDNESYQCRAGDVTNDNAITIEDVAQVLEYYKDFSVTVDESDRLMVASDINKDGIITIQDAALIAINWSDFKVEGDK